MALAAVRTSTKSWRRRRGVGTAVVAQRAVRRAGGGAGDSRNLQRDVDTGGPARTRAAIRSAVGASRSALLGLVLKEALMLSGAGITAGAAIALAASGVLRNLLYDVSATDARCSSHRRSVWKRLSWPAT